jgi:hypothetical protein
MREAKCNLEFTLLISDLASVVILIPFGYLYFAADISRVVSVMSEWWKGVIPVSISKIKTPLAIQQ